MKGSDVYAIIPARGGSKSVPEKNIRVFREHPLIAYTIASAKLSNSISRVIVSTDSEKIADVAKKYGAEVPFLRPSEISRDNSTDLEFVKHAITWFNEREHKCPEYMVHLRPTTPIRDPRIIDDAIEIIKKDDSATSLRSGHRSVNPPYKWFVAGDGKYWKPLMARTSDEANNPRQDYPDVYVPNGYVDIIKTKFVKEFDLLHGEKMIGFLTNEVLDIDTEEDFKKMDAFSEMKESFVLLHNYLEGFGDE